jgi:hypothetical protein
MSQIQRKSHRILALGLGIPLAVTLATGIAYRTGRAWFGMQKETGEKILHIHTGEWMGEAAGFPYVVATGLGLLALVATGAWLLWKSGLGRGPRLPHRLLGALLILPLAAAAATGILFMASESWLHFSKDTEELLLNIHQGSWLGKTWRPFYVLFMGFGLLTLIWTGMRMVWPRKIRS